MSTPNDGHDSPRSLACEALDRILVDAGPADSILEAGRRRLGPRDRALFDELTLGTVRWLRRLDDVLEQASRRSVAQIDSPLRAPLRVGAYQLLFLDRVPAHAAVNESAEEVRRRGQAHAVGFVNGVLRHLARRPRLSAWPVRAGDAVARLAIEQSHPDWLVRRWYGRFGAQRTGEMLAANNRPRPMTLLTFRDRGGRQATRQALRDVGVETQPSPLSPLGLIVRHGEPLRTPLFVQGSLYVQDAASQIAALLPLPGAGERVLDVASAPGGKTFSLLAWEPAARVTAVDRRLDRVLVLRHNVSRLQRDVLSLVMDGGKPAVRSLYDRVVIDLPCSGTGTFRKHPELKWRLAPEFLEESRRRGSEIAAAASACVRPGGLICIITCSIEPEENEEVVEALRHREPGLIPAELTSIIPVEARSGLIGDGAWRTLPGDDHDGFTVHVLRKSN